MFDKECLKLVTEGTCEADCCGCVPFKRELVGRHTADIQEQFKDALMGNEEWIWPLTDDLHCVFLNRDTHLCAIYSERLDMCIKFGDESHVQMCCPYLRADGTRRNRAERRRTQRAVAKGQDKLKENLAKKRDSTDWRW